MKTIIYFVVVTEDGERESMQLTYSDRVEAEDVIGSMECGVFDSDTVKYEPVRIEYVLDEEEA
jgi:hypothetical protein